MLNGGCLPYTWVVTRFLYTTRESHEQGNHHRRRSGHRRHHRASLHNVNVLDISQTIIDGYFNMMMIVDYANADKDFGAMVGNLEDLGDDIGVRIRCQREEIFTKMHRI